MGSDNGTKNADKEAQFWQAMTLIFTIVACGVVGYTMKGGLDHHNCEICDAARMNDITLVKDLLAGGADPNQRDLRTSALVTASHEGHMEVVDVLLKAGAHPDLPHVTSGQTALMHAARSGHHELVKKLLKAGANPNVISPHSYSALHFAALHGGVESLHHLKAHGADLKKAKVSGHNGKATPKTASDLAAKEDNEDAYNLLQKWERETWREGGEPAKE